jgi:hypothetical protein
MMKQQLMLLSFSVKRGIEAGNGLISLYEASLLL